MTRKRRETEGSHPDAAYTVGFGKPPKDHQFKPGQSGNPRGRPKKTKSALTDSLPALLPTSAALRNEAGRIMTVRDGDKREQITTIEAAIRAMAIKGIQGSVFALREFVRLVMEEDQRRRAELEENYEFWREYKAKGTDQLKRALAKGLPEPDLVPHPEDIVLNSSTLEVTLTGPVDAEGAACTARTKRASELAFEAMLYFDEEFRVVLGDQPDLRLGFLGAHFIQLLAHLPPRLRPLSQSFHAELEQRLLLPRRKWEALLRKDHEDFGLHLPLRRGPMPSLSVREEMGKLDPKMQEQIEDWLMALCNKIEMRRGC